MVLLGVEYLEYLNKLSLLVGYVIHPCNSNDISLQCILEKNGLCVGGTVM